MLLRYTMRNYSNRPHQRKIVQYVFCVCRNCIRVIDICRAVGKLYVVDVVENIYALDVFMQLTKWIRNINVRFVELLLQKRTRRHLKC